MFFVSYTCMEKHTCSLKSQKTLQLFIWINIYLKLKRYWSSKAVFTFLTLFTQIKLLCFCVLKRDLCVKSAVRLFKEILVTKFVYSYQNFLFKKFDLNFYCVHVAFKILMTNWYWKIVVEIEEFDFVTYKRCLRIMLNLFREYHSMYLFAA